MKYPLLCTCVNLLICLLTGGAFAQEEKLSTLLDRAPAATNTLGYIHTESLSRLVGDSDVADRMAKKIDDLWFVSEVDITQLTPRWEAGFANFLQAYKKEDIVTTVGGYVDKIGDREAIWSPNQSYIVPLDTNVVGFLRPANRSMLASWLKETSGNAVPSYLREKSKQSEKYLSLMVALNLEHAFSPAALKYRLQDLESLNKMSDGKREQVATVLASSRGASIILGRKNLSQCILELSFKQSPRVLEPIANSLFHEISVKNGSEIEELSTWQSKVDGNKLLFKGKLSRQALHSLLGIFTLTNRSEELAESMSSGRQPTTKPNDGPSGYKTRDYFQDVRKIIEQVRNHKAKTSGALAKWNNNRARRIDDMSIIGVDDEMVDYGAFVSASLRNDALSIQKINIKAGQVKADQSLNDGYYYNREGYYDYGYGYYNSVDQQRVTSQKARGSAYASYRQMLSAVDQRTADVKKSMERKYQINF